MYDNRDSIDFGKTAIGPLFAGIFFPTLLGMVFNMAFLLTDGVLVGHGIGGGGLAAINLIAPIMMLINGMGMMLGMGASVVAAIHLSKGNVKAARINVTQAFEAGIAISLLIGAVGYLFPGAVLGLLARWLAPTIVNLVPVLVGIAIIAAGVSNLMAARNMNYPKATMLGPVLTIVLGALVVFHPGFVLSTVIFLAGVALVLNGLSELELIRRVW